jgi:signal transduction histidine kinase
MGKHFSAFWTDCDKDRYEDFWDTLKKPGAVDQKLVRLLKRNGRSISVILTAQAEADQLGAFRRAHCVFADVTAIKEAEQAMRVAKEKAEENDQLKSAFLANMSHEIRSPMNAILGFSDLLKDPKLDDTRKRKFIRMIHERGEDLLRIIDDIIDISKLEAGSLKFNYEMVNLNDFLENLQMSFMQERRRQKKEDIYFVMERAPELKPVSWKTDKVRTRQILMNFYSNALKFTDRGYVKLIVERAGEDDIRFSVEDTGIGIAKDQQELIFERFRQVDLEYKSSRSGTGLGLSISRNLAHEMDGHVELISDIDKGSKFSLVLPLTDMILGREKPKEDQKKAASTNQYTNKNILVVEDDFNNYLYLKNAIEKLNVSVVWARNGMEAMKTVQGVFRPDLILMDIRLPGINGLELTETIKENYPDIPVIAQTAFAQQEDREQAMKSGCDDYIAKPVPMELLYAIIGKYLQ